MRADGLDPVALRALRQASRSKLVGGSAVARAKTAVAIGHQRMFEFHPLLPEPRPPHPGDSELPLTQIDDELGAIGTSTSPSMSAPETERLRSTTG